MPISITTDYSTHEYTQLAQSRPSGTSAVSLLSPSANERLLVGSIIVANTTGSPAGYSIYHDEDGSTYDETTTLAFGVSLDANSLIELSFSIPMINTSGNLAIQTDTSNALTFTAYGFKKKV